jgi:hypothetical protein
LELGIIRYTWTDIADEIDGGFSFMLSVGLHKPHEPSVGGFKQSRDGWWLGLARWLFSQYI